MTTAESVPPGQHGLVVNLAPVPGTSWSGLPEDPLDLVASDAMVAVAMSGGVDSSVAAARCVARGFRVVGITLAMWRRDRKVERDRGCCSVDAVDDARRVATRLGIPHYVWDLEEDFNQRVIADFEREYAAGRTPNPCVRCNQTVKFGVLLDRARAIGASHVATGHYARTGHDGGAWTLHRARDRRKDQAYTLHRLDQEQLAAAVFPIGALADKAAVRGEAARLHLATAAKPDSQDLCFVEGSMEDELRRRLGDRARPGPITSLDGQVVGEHRGIVFYTVGQRGRLNVAADRPDAPPLYVVEIDVDGNRVVVGPASALLRSRIEVADCSWIRGTPPAAGSRCDLQLRSHGNGDAAVVTAVMPDASITVRCDPPAAQVVPGQAAVLYQGDAVLGGGVVMAAS